MRAADAELAEIPSPWYHLRQSHVSVGWRRAFGLV